MKRTQNVPTESIALAFVAMQYNVKLADVPASPAYLVCHDHFDNGAMEVWPMSDKVAAENCAHDYQCRLDDHGIDGCHFAAYTELPRRRVWKLHPAKTS